MAVRQKGKRKIVDHKPRLSYSTGKHRCVRPGKCHHLAVFFYGKAWKYPETWVSRVGLMTYWSYSTLPIWYLVALTEVAFVHMILARGCFDRSRLSCRCDTTQVDRIQNKVRTTARSFSALVKKSGREGGMENFWYEDKEGFVYEGGGVYRLLILDGHGSHLTPTFDEICEQNKGNTYLYVSVLLSPFTTPGYRLFCGVKTCVRPASWIKNARWDTVSMHCYYEVGDQRLFARDLSASSRLVGSWKCTEVRVIPFIQSPSHFLNNISFKYPCCWSLRR